MGSLRALSIFVIVFSVIELTLLLIVGVNLFPPPGDKECNYAAITEIPNLANTREGPFTCVDLHDVASLLYRTFIPFERLVDNLLWQLSFHCTTVFIITVIIIVVNKCEKDYSRPVQRKVRRLIARYDKHNAALIAKHTALVHQKISYPEIC
ncbi:hypothetical protein PRIPAC_97247 [Pristionchus pacificus]|uniref:Uncharacterized protein n=1 Tax=Pristionchus pacificus TaxID=54126 RepID=A0A2A6B2S8_PRIPA|nr:hypothetical protein PRIPAC_97247 [Pristionchus pacificus]|eukprot:PDM60187.1 hypothetical protein PRIPAC_54012 [Pristionchus pacificus]